MMHPWKVRSAGLEWLRLYHIRDGVAAATPEAMPRSLFQHLVNFHQAQNLSKYKSNIESPQTIKKINRKIPCPPPP